MARQECNCRQSDKLQSDIVGLARGPRYSEFSVYLDSRRLRQKQGEVKHGLIQINSVSVKKLVADNTRKLIHSFI